MQDARHSPPYDLPPPATVQLYGGAMTCELPEVFMNISGQTNAPDHQEVMLWSEQKTSVIIEVLDRLSDRYTFMTPGDPGDSDDSDEDESGAMLHYLATLTADSADRDDNGLEVPIGDIQRCREGLGKTHVAFTVGTYVKNPDALVGSSRAEPHRTVIWLGLIRYRFPREPERDADILIHVVVKYYPGTEDDEDEDLNKELLSEKAHVGRRIRNNVMRTLRVVDESFFAPQEDAENEEDEEETVEEDPEDAVETIEEDVEDAVETVEENADDASDEDPPGPARVRGTGRRRSP
ncbi:hypothetical protein BDZ85DRAFT_260880 [Elsinoe ampelina]|uniref:Uncharacterized protein n=1 Tax=Elsinoe ampelina TaxID=302913 RepID=A0A6A6GFA6_9PEZI|nr:hypothetical protein BDZ85DRAFT_260880 [Elsinoe ampelina]